MVVGFGNAMLFAILPPLAREIGLADSAIAWIFSLSALIWVFSSPFWGRQSDRYGRRPIAALGLYAYAVSMGSFALIAGLALADAIPVTLAFFGLMLARAIFGIAGSATSPAAQAYVADRANPAARTEEIAALTATFAIGSALGPPVSGLMATQFGLVAPVVITALLALLAGSLVLRLLPETPPTVDARPAAQSSADSWRLFRDPRVSAYLVYGIGLSSATGVLAQTYGLYVMDRLDVSGAASAGVIAQGLMVGALALIATQVGLLPRLKLRPRALMLSGAVLIGLGVGVQLLAQSQTSLLLSQLLQGFGFGLARPGFSGGASLAVSAREQGATAGLVVAVNGAGFVISPLIGGVLYDYLDPIAPLCVVLALTVAMAVFAVRSRRLRAWETPSDPGGLDQP